MVSSDFPGELVGKSHVYTHILTSHPFDQLLSVRLLVKGIVLSFLLGFNDIWPFSEIMAILLFVLVALSGVRVQRLKLLFLLALEKLYLRLLSRTLDWKCGTFF